VFCEAHEGRVFLALVVLHADGRLPVRPMQPVEFAARTVRAQLLRGGRRRSEALREKFGETDVHGGSVEDLSPWGQP